MRGFCSIVRLVIPVPSDDILQICSLSQVTDDLVDKVRTLLKSFSIRGVLQGGRHRVSFHDWAVAIASMAWGQSGSVNRGGVLQAVLNYFERVLTNVDELVRTFFCRENFVITLCSKTICCRSKKRWSVDDYLVSLLKDRDESNTLVVMFVISPQYNKKVFVSLFAE